MTEENLSSSQSHGIIYVPVMSGDISNFFQTSYGEIIEINGRNCIFLRQNFVILYERRQ
jgi:hypothetical protein